MKLINMRKKIIIVKTFIVKGLGKLINDLVVSGPLTIF